MLTAGKITIRDEFAMNAMRTSFIHRVPNLSEKDLVELAYRIADQMLINKKSHESK